ncbi:uroporphyrinogen-III C-methyltransferase [Psychrobacter sanguinis]|uniref:uroporphyrinogen-III C-methyltransferase n=1 Tax=Psychrobacter sanguinis TaxID=861445 RepID=UPI00191B88CF|nr:uroporphyrinogen-III C-methyltransferase [Psychrobacter sanguinis]UEC24771.1 uroporphyrinogen-III C-methyltransferase [Psychrobacter sanguinis]
MTHFDISTLNSAQVIKGRSKLPLTPYDYGNELPIIKAEDKVKQAKKGVVYLVGAGSGDPELLTLKAYRIMQQADVVLYDSLVSEDILDMCSQQATKIFVGKRCDNHALPQEQINQLLVTHAQAGKCVVRLKGGDPFIFGRGGEELQTVVENGVYFESIPGITAASSSSIPLTHRHCAQSVKFVTAFKKTNCPNEDFSEMLDPTQTVVLYMGLNRLAGLTDGLIRAGRSGDTPFAVVSHASLPTQQVLIGTLDDIAAKQLLAKLPTPALLIMGDVVNLHQQLSDYNLANIEVQHRFTQQQKEAELIA